MDKRKTTGDEGEERACAYLEARGYRILKKKYKLFCGEIDILAETPWKLGQKRTVVIVEVKTVTGSGFGGAVDLVRYRKQIKLRTLARAISQDYPGRTLRIDVIGVDKYATGEEAINHIENAVQ